MMLIRTYRVRGHLAAKLDPLGLAHHDMPVELTPAYHGFDDTELDRPIWLGGAMGFEQASIREIIAALQATYCGPIGFEYMHINDLEERRFIQERIEGEEETVQFTPEGKQSILDKVIHGEQWEKFLAKKYVGTKRFGLDGGESAIPALEAVIKYGGADRRQRDRRRHGPPRPPERPHQRHGQALPRDLPRIRRRRRPTRPMSAGRATSNITSAPRSDREFDGNQGPSVAWSPNPSHLEAVDPVVLGKARAVQTCAATRRATPCLPILLHGDAAFAGQGIVAECFGFSGLPGYGTGGTIHFVINNQVGFTTSPQFARSSPYPSDIAKSVQAPILHVNGDDPEAVTFCCKLAIEFRQRFNRDIVIDMWCYRRFGHNEGDEPSFTQPLMYAEIRQHPLVSPKSTARG